MYMGYHHMLNRESGYRVVRIDLPLRHFESPLMAVDKICLVIINADTDRA
jgi:hypothetical protein